MTEDSRVAMLARVPHEDEETDSVEIEDDGTADEGADVTDELMEIEDTEAESIEQDE